MQEHNHNDHINHDLGNNKVKYLKFTAILLSILGASILVANNTSLVFFDSFMGVFFVVFASFKISRLKVFAYGFQSYDLIAKRSLIYAYIYPFIQLSLGLIYLAGLGAIGVDLFVIIISLISGAGVMNSIFKKQMVHCVCLGNVIKLPLSTISFVEDFGMAIMALAMVIMR